MPSGGNNAKTTHELKASGGYRADRHAGRVDGVRAVGTPQMPDGLNAAQRRDWDQIIADLPDGVLGRLDTGLLTEYVMVSQYVRDTRAQLADDPTDKDARIAYSAYFDRWFRLVNELGLSPMSRARMRCPIADDQESNPLLEILERMRGNN